MTAGELHPSPQELERFLSGTLPPCEARAIVAHLLPGCEVCQERMEPSTQAMFKPGRPSAFPLPWSPSEYDFPIFKAFGSVRRFAEKQAEDEPREVRKDTEKILLDVFAKEAPAPEAATGPSSRASRSGLRSAGSWRRCEALLEQSRELRASDPEGMVLTASLAASWADRLDPRVYAAPKLADLRALARAELGNARRVTGDIAGAEAEMSRALELAREGTGDPQLLVRVLDFMASLYTDQRRFPEALELLDKIYRVHQSRGDAHLAGRALISKGIAAGHSLDSEQAIRLLSQGLAQIDPQRDPRLVLAAVHNLIWFLVEAGRLAEADRLLEQSRNLYAAHGERLDHLKVLWLEGRIAAGLSDEARAERSFQQVRAGFEEAELPYDAALVSLDLAAVWLRQSRTLEIRHLLDGILAIFKARNIRREAIGAVLMLKEALRKDSATLTLLQAVESDLQRFGREAARR
jgi:tetratricopeptide (TPR) repeat protein